ncbi:hypothetical protein CK203_062078 [Vitis vinifera]|uniref:DUF659 domain-containing protein n=1 Tax=Vitis vinifera TaxID=29760 RepID=A0A438GMU6_VITVI|nr:hypothetical protein CK203_062078 [Vitis vinifera]
MDNESETQVDSSASGRRDPGWKYGRLVNEKDLNTIICIFCDKVTKGGIYRHKQHLVSGYRNAKKCRKCLEHVREEMKEYMSSKKNQKEQMNMGSEYVNEDLFGLEDEDIGEEINSRTNITNISSGGSNRGGSGGRTFSSKKPRQKGPMDHFFTPNAEMVVQNQRSGKMNQTTINDAYKKEARERACTLITRWMYEAAIPFNAVTYPSFQPIEAIGQYGVGMKGPTFHEVRVTNLKKELALTKDLMKDHMVEWGKNGCSIMSDGWTDRKERTLVNFLVNCSKGTMFMQSIDASSMIKTGEKMFELLDKWVEQVGEENVIQVITDNHSSYVMAGRLLELKRPHLYWTPCAAHCLDLMLEDIGKLPNIKRTLERAISLNGYIYNRSGLLNMMRRFTRQRELLRPAKTRFATAFITLLRLHEQKNNLRKMFTSSDWSDSKWAKEQKGKTIANIVLMPSFWNTIVFCLKVSGPLVRVLRLVDGEKKAPMGYIYEAMNRAKDAIVRSFNGNEDKYKEIFNIIDKRWEIQLHRPLHAAGYFLNPEFFYDKPEIEHDAEIMSDLYKCILRLTRDPAKQEKVCGRTPNLQKFAMKVLNLTCSASGCDRNWSIFENIHSKRRNRLDHQRLNDLVYTKYNRALKRRYNERNTIDPISLKDIDDSNEWLIGRMEDEDSHGGAQDDFVFDDDNLTWGDVARAAGAEEARFDTRARARASSSIIPPTRGIASSFKTLPSYSLIDEDEDGDMVDSADEEDGEGYKCGDGNDDDDDFVDLEE